MNCTAVIENRISYARVRVCTCMCVCTYHVHFSRLVRLVRGSSDWKAGQFFTERKVTPSLPIKTLDSERVLLHNAGNWWPMKGRGRRFATLGWNMTQFPRKALHFQIRTRNFTKERYSVEIRHGVTPWYRPQTYRLSLSFLDLKQKERKKERKNPF